jgi:shikimate kinase
MMGAGKSTVGKLLATRLTRRFVDTDKRIVERAGVEIPVIFDVEGEPGFRAREHAVIAELASESAESPAVIATGGGAILSDANRQAMTASGVVIYLAATQEELWRRLRRDRSRPLLRQADPEATLKKILSEREPTYRALAHHAVASDNHSAAKLADRIALLLHTPEQ